MKRYNSETVVNFEPNYNCQYNLVFCSQVT